MMVNLETTRNRKSLIALWTLRVLLAALFLMTAAMKFLGGTDIISEFNTIGLGQWFRLFTAAIEFLGAVLILWPAFSVYGALLLVCVCIGAFVTQMFVLHGDVIHTIVIALFAAAAIYLQRDQLAPHRV
jgi:uncharacterized membrane protein YphA (DoxX/SURF4 family)